MAYWWWLTPRGTMLAPSAPSQRGVVMRALAGTQPARLAAIVARAEADGVRTTGPLSDMVSFYLWDLKRAGLAEAAKERP